MSQLAAPPACVCRHRLLVVGAANANALLRLLEPFVVHDVTPVRIVCEVTPAGLEASLDFDADADLAERLRQRLAALVVVASARLVTVAGQLEAAA